MHVEACCTLIDRMPHSLVVQPRGKDAMSTIRSMVVDDAHGEVCWAREMDSHVSAQASLRGRCDAEPMPKPITPHLSRPSRLDSTTLSNSLNAAMHAARHIR
jgi:hypothetical protein